MGPGEGLGALWRTFESAPPGGGARAGERPWRPLPTGTLQPPQLVSGAPLPRQWANNFLFGRRESWKGIPSPDTCQLGFLLGRGVKSPHS